MIEKVSVSGVVDNEVIDKVEEGNWNNLEECVLELEGEFGLEYEEVEEGIEVYFGCWDKVLYRVEK